MTGDNLENKKGVRREHLSLERSTHIASINK